jgi:hypothetical protein
MLARPVPRCHWRSYGDDPLPTGAEALDEPFRAILGRMRHDGCGGLAGNAELLTGIEGASSRPVRRIVLITYPMLRAAPSRRR